jgi:hypothetical protein
LFRHFGWSRLSHAHRSIRAQYVVDADGAATRPERLNRLYGDSALN